MKLNLSQLPPHIIRLNEAELYGHALQKMASPQAVDRESDLHDYIGRYCREHGWLAFHGSMAHKTRRTAGEPDFVILAPGRILMIECKRKGGKTTPEQNAVIGMAERLGHRIHVVSSEEEFNKITYWETA